MKQTIMTPALRLTTTVLVALFVFPQHGFTTKLSKPLQVYPIPKIVLPVIEQFSAAGDPCRITRTGFLSYRVKNRIKRIDIFALYYDGRIRRFYNRVLTPIRNNYSDMNIADPGMERGISGYSIRVLNERGFIAKRKLDFKTPKIVFFRLKSRTMSKSIIASRGNNYALVRYSIPIQHKNIQKILVNGTIKNKQGFSTVRAQFNNVKLWFTVTWNNLTYKDEIRFKVYAFGNDGCRSRDWKFQWNATLPADRR